jgi:carbamoyltransferase
MKVLGISPLDKDATASLVEDGRILFAAAEERFTRHKQHAGFPHLAIQAALEHTGIHPDEIDAIAYPFLSWEREVAHIDRCLAADRAREFAGAVKRVKIAMALARVPGRVTTAGRPIQADGRMRKSRVKEVFYRMAGVHPLASAYVTRWSARRWRQRSAAEHRHWHAELEAGLARLGLRTRLTRYEHHLAHASAAYHTSGFDRALIVTLDGYGSGLAGAISLGEQGRIERLAGIDFPHSLGTYYEGVTSSLGFHPTHHAGKTVGLAAYGDPTLLADIVQSRFDASVPGTFRIFQNLNPYFARHLASHFRSADVAAAYQQVLEAIATALVGYWVTHTRCSAVVLCGGVAANVKMNQRIHEIDGVERTFIYPNMGDGGCGTGIALHVSWPGGVGEPLRDVYLGPSYTAQQIRDALDRAGLAYTEPADFAAYVGERLHQKHVIGRFAGRMEYGPRALGNRSILCHAGDPQLNRSLNEQLGRSEFMPFAPVTLWEERERCYQHLRGAEHAAEFMTLTFDCTPWMIAHCPAAVHVDGSARPQLIRREVNRSYYDIIADYARRSGIPCLINTSFNMHEEPIVCTPRDAIETFLRGDLDGLAIGPYFAANPWSPADRRVSAARAAAPV